MLAQRILKFGEENVKLRGQRGAQSFLASLRYGDGPGVEQ
jgi:hypothetical protein